MKKLLVGAALAVSMLAAAPAANAATYVTLPAAASDGSLTGSFSKENVGFGAFSHEYTFNFPASGWASTYVSSIKARLESTNIDFTSISLNGNPFTIENGNFDIGYLEDLFVGTELQSLVINGVSGGNGSYSVDVAFSPSAVPEPATWAMMIIGFTGAGVAIRRRRRDSSVAFA